MKAILPVVIAIIVIPAPDLPGQAGKAQRPACSSPAAGVPMRVTGDCVEPRFNDPYVDIDKQRNMPVHHRYVHGGFKGTDAKFSFYFPPRERE